MSPSSSPVFPVVSDRDSPAAVLERAARVAVRVAGLDGATLLEPLIRDEFVGRIALVSSFGTESAVLLALVAEIDRNVPVLFVDTGRLFGETKRYRDQLATRLGLTNVSTLAPPADVVAKIDKDGMLFERDPDTCCMVRKITPLEHALARYDAWISGRKRFQGAARTDLPLIEVDRTWVKINPLAHWSREQLQQEFNRRGLPTHPLEADGFSSIGCMPCSSRVPPGEDVRAGRWAGLEKT